MLARVIFKSSRLFFRFQNKIIATDVQFVAHDCHMKTGGLFGAAKF